MRVVERLKAWWQGPSWTDKAIVLLTVAIVAVGVTQTFIFRRQWQEMHSGGADTHDLALAAKSQADEAKVQAEQARIQAQKATESADYMRQLAEETLAQAKATNRLALEARRSAEYAKQLAETSSLELKTTQETAKNDERAWIGEQGSILTTFEVGKVITITINLSNTGKSPARHITYTANIGTYERNITPPFVFDVPGPGWRGIASIPAQGGYQIQVTTPGLLSQETKDLLENRDLIIWMWGSLHYEDIFNEGHITQFCSFSLDTTFNKQPPEQGMVMHSCPAGNGHDEMD